VELLFLSPFDAKSIIIVINEYIKILKLGLAPNNNFVLIKKLLYLYFTNRRKVANFWGRIPTRACCFSQGFNIVCNFSSPN
jgi:hypothetical protein